jgi:hypothetical protein
VTHDTSWVRCLFPAKGQFSGASPRSEVPYLGVWGFLGDNVIRFADLAVRSLSFPLLAPTQVTNIFFFQSQSFTIRDNIAHCVHNPSIVNEVHRLVYTSRWHFSWSCDVNNNNIHRCEGINLWATIKQRTCGSRSTLETCIREMLNSHLGQETDYPKFFHGCSQSFQVNA